MQYLALDHGLSKRSQSFVRWEKTSRLCGIWKIMNMDGNIVSSHTAPVPDEKVSIRSGPSIATAHSIRFNSLFHIMCTQDTFLCAPCCHHLSFLYWKDPVFKWAMDASMSYLSILKTLGNHAEGLKKPGLWWCRAAGLLVHLDINYGLALVRDVGFSVWVQQTPSGWWNHHQETNYYVPLPCGECNQHKLISSALWSLRAINTPPW